MSISSIFPAAPSFGELPQIFSTETPSPRKADVGNSNIDPTNSAVKEQSFTVRNTQSLNSVQNTRISALQKLAQLNQLFYIGSKRKLGADVIKRGIKIGLLSRESASNQNDAVKQVVSQLKLLLEENGSPQYAIPRESIIAIYGLINNFDELRKFLQRGEEGYSYDKHCLKIAIEKGLVKNATELSVLLQDAKEIYASDTFGNFSITADVCIKLAIKHGIINEYKDLEECFQVASFHDLHRTIGTAIEHGIITQESQVQEYIIATKDKDIHHEKSWDNFHFNLVLLAAHLHILGFDKPDFSESINKLQPYACFNLLVKLATNKSINNSKEFNSYLETLRARLKKDLKEGDDWTIKAWKEKFQLDKEAPEESIEEAGITKLKAIAYASGVIDEKPDITPFYDKDIRWELSHLEPGTITIYGTEGIKDKASLDRCLNIIRNNTEDYSRSWKVINTIIEAIKSGVIQNADEYCDEILQKDGLVTCSDFIIKVVEQKLPISQSTIDDCLLALEKEIEKITKDPFFLAGFNPGDFKKYDKYLELLFCLSEYRLNPLGDVIKDLKQYSNSEGLPPLSFNTALEHLKQTVTDDLDLQACRQNAITVFQAIRKRNEEAIRLDQKIDVGTLEIHLAPGLAHMFAISEPVAGRLLEEHLHNRGYLPIVKNVFERLAFLKPQEVQTLTTFYKKNEALLLDKPNFLIDLCGYIETYRKLGLSFADLQIDLMQDASSLNEISNRLGKTVIKKLCAPENLNINVDLEKYAEGRNIHDEWDFKHLGLLVSRKDSWNEEQTRMFSLLLKAKFEGTLKGLVFPPDFGEYKPVIYGSDEETLALVEKIRYHNLNLLYEMEQHGLKIEPWLNPNEAVKPEAIASAGTQRSPNDIIKDFQSKVEALQAWLDSGHKTDSVVDGLKDSQEVSARVQAMYGKFWNSVKVELQPMLSKKSRDMKGTLLQLQELQKRHNDQADKFKAKHRLFVDSISKLFPEGNLPEPILDMQIILEEITNYNPQKQDDARMLLVHFWERDPGFDSFLGNYAGSCTALDKNATAIFQFLLDVGTLYVPISELEENTYADVFEKANYTPKGYARLYPALSEDGLPAFFIDSTDGREAQVNLGKVQKHINQLADAIGINRNQIVDRLKSKDWGACKDKIGGVISSDYFHHFGKQLQPRFIDSERKAILDKWAQEKGWLQVAC